MITELKGDLLRSTKISVLCHGCNCFGAMGAGIALQIKAVYPEAYQTDLNFEIPVRASDRVGKVSFCTTKNFNMSTRELIIANCYTQYKPGANFNMNAFKNCMKIIDTKFSGKTIGMPKIGAGIGGGNWNEIKKVLEETVKNVDILVYII